MFIQSYRTDRAPAPAPPPAPAPAPPSPPDNYPTTFDYYMSPTGNNANDGLTALTPWKTFAKAFSISLAGKRLGLLDGLYGIAQGTGCMNFQGTNSAQVPSGTSRAAMTEICAVNPGGAIVDGAGDYNGAAVFLGRSTRKDSFIKLRGFSTRGDIQLYNTTRVFVKDCGSRGAISIGTNDVASGATLTNTFNLVEDCWAWSYGYRLLSSNYQAHSNIWRRMVIRGDGGGPNGSGNPNVGFTVYNSQFCAVQNMLILDRLVGAAEPYADFATAQHDGVNPDINLYYFGGNTWEGCMSVNSADYTLNMEVDNAQAGLITWSLKNMAFFPGGINLSPGGSGTGVTECSAQVDHITALGASGRDAQLRVRNMPKAGYLRNSITANSSTWGCNTDGATVADYICRYLAANGDVGSVGHPFSFNPRAGSPASVKYLVRIENGSSAKAAGALGEDLGANIMYRVGLDGTFRDDTGYNTVTSMPLWPWPNEARIKAEMSVPYSGINAIGGGTVNLTTTTTQRGFCTTGAQLNGVTQVSLTSYIWEALGNQMPTDLYA